MTEPPKIGTTAPDFTLLNQRNEPVTFSEQFKGGPVVVYFYPKDNTPGCTRETRTFQKLYAEFTKHNATILGISSDTVASHEKFSCDLDLSFSILADEGGAVRKLWKVPKAFIFEGRETYTFDKDGILRDQFSGIMKGGEHAEHALTIVKQLSPEEKPTEEPSPVEGEEKKAEENEEEQKQDDAEKKEGEGETEQDQPTDGKEETTDGEKTEEKIDDEPKPEQPATGN